MVKKKFVLDERVMKHRLYVGCFNIEDIKLCFKFIKKDIDELAKNPPGGTWGWDDKVKEIIDNRVGKELK